MKIPSDLDKEWYYLMITAKRLKISPEEVRKYLNKKEIIKLK